MSQTHHPREIDRRSFLKNVAGLGGAALAAAYASPSLAAAAGRAGLAAAADVRDSIGLQLFTVRDLTAKDYPGTLRKVAEIGYKRVQTTGSYGTYTAKQIHDFLQSAGLTSPATHVNPPLGPDFERTLEGYQLIGHKYTTINLNPRPAGGAARPPAAGAPAAGAPGAGAQGRAPGMPASMSQPQTLDSVKRTAEQLNRAGEVTKKYGIKVIIHNHTNEFRPLSDSPRTEYDVLLAETDPALVAMELDVGWARAAGQDVLEMFRRNPGRYEVWHVKDFADLAQLHQLPQLERMRAARIVPIGEGEIDYKPIFAQAALAGMKYAFVEQDSAPQSGDSLGAAATSYRALMRLLA